MFKLFLIFVILSMTKFHDFKELRNQELFSVDISNVNSTWANIYKKAPDNGFLIIKRIFRQDPVIKSFFEEYITMDSTEAEMTNSSEFKCHIIEMMHVVHDAIQNIRNPDILMPLIINTGEYYKSIGVKRSHLLVAQDVVMNFLREDLKYNKNILNSWQKYIDEITTYMFFIIFD